MSKHTPGPWHPGHLGSEGRCQCRTICDEGYAGGIATVHVDNGIKMISEGGNDCPPREEAIANMHLIAAAPDMFAALEPVNSMEMWTESAADDEIVIMTVGTIRKMRAAFAKAAALSQTGA